MVFLFLYFFSFADIYSDELEYDRWGKELLCQQPRKNDRGSLTGPLDADLLRQKNEKKTYEENIE